MERFTHTSCPLCGNSEIKLEMPITDLSISKEDFEIWKCSQCDFRFTQDAPAASVIGPYYQSEDYISHSDTKEGFVNRAYHTVRDIMLARKFKLVKRLTSGKRLLDMGCGTGYFLNYVNQQGFTAKGVEIDEGAREFGKKNFGVDIVSPEEMMEGPVNEEFDTITLWHVLEHIYDLDGYITRLKELLADDGHILIAVPNRDSYDAQQYKSYWAAYDVPIHLWHFTPATLTKLAEKHDLEVKGISKLPFDPFYISMLSSKYRGDSLGLIRGGLIGFISFFKALFNAKKASSPIYILRKKG